MTTPANLPGIDTVAGAVIDHIPDVPSLIAENIASSALKRLFDEGWRQHHVTNGVRPPMEMIRRWVLYDAFSGDTPEAVAALLGLPPISDELKAQERAASMRRLERLGRLGEGVEDHARLFANIFVGLQEKAAMNDPYAAQLGEETWQAAKASMFNYLNVTCMALLSLLHGLDIVEEGKGEVLHGL